MEYIILCFDGWWLMLFKGIFFNAMYPTLYIEECKIINTYIIIYERASFKESA